MHCRQVGVDYKLQMADLEDATPSSKERTTSPKRFSLLNFSSNRIKPTPEEKEELSITEVENDSSSGRPLQAKKEKKRRLKSAPPERGTKKTLPIAGSVLLSAAFIYDIYKAYLIFMASEICELYML